MPKVLALIEGIICDAIVKIVTKPEAVRTLCPSFLSHLQLGAPYAENVSNMRALPQYPSMKVK